MAFVIPTAVDFMFYLRAEEETSSFSERRCVRMVKMQGAEDEGAGSVLKYMTKPEDDSNVADWPL